MTDTHQILSNLNSGIITISDVPDEMILQLSSCILLEELEGPDEILTRLSPLQRDVLSLQSLLIEGDIANAAVISEELLNRSRSKEERDLECEVRIRMERALLAVDGPDRSGQELRWCSERLKAIAPNTALLDGFCEGKVLILLLKPQKFLGAFGAEDFLYLDPLKSAIFAILDD